jgi:hypothetical protein
VSTPSLCRDPNNITRHIYNPARLQTVKSRATASGIGDYAITEDARDCHEWFHVDSQYANLPNSINNDYRRGDLLAEIVCATSVNQQDAVLACQGYTKPYSSTYGKPEHRCDETLCSRLNPRIDENPSRMIASCLLGLEMHDAYSQELLMGIACRSSGQIHSPTPTIETLR